jgi:ketosteroid isomerase-like protein
MFRASRDGVDACVLDGGALRPLRELVRALVTRLLPVSRDLGDEDALAGVERILADGGGAARRRADAVRGGAREMLTATARETAMSASARPTAGPSAARRWLDARACRDYAALAALTHEDATWDSPVEGTIRGRARIVDQARASHNETDSFSSQVLGFEARGDRAAALVRNTGRRGDEVLDSRQALLFRERDGLVASVRIVVDDPEAVTAFWTED